MGESVNGFWFKKNTVDEESLREGGMFFFFVDFFVLQYNMNT